MARYTLIVDSEKCNGCHACFLSCKDEYQGNAKPPYTAEQGEGQCWLSVEQLEQGRATRLSLDFYPSVCRHCREPACAAAAPAGAVILRDDGIVLFDGEKLRGHRELAAACPYGCIRYNPVSEQPQKCTLCAHLLDGGENVPRCVESCPTGALVFGDMENPAGPLAELLERQPQLREAQAPGAVIYRGLPGAMLAGEVYFEDSGLCASGVSVVLAADGGRFETKTDIFGEFRLKGLTPGKAGTVLVSAAGYEPVEIAVTTGYGRDLGELGLRRV